MSKTFTLLINCPWCGAAQEQIVRKAQIVDTVCNGGATSTTPSTKNWCKRSIRLRIDKSGHVKEVERVSNPNAMERLAPGNDDNTHPIAEVSSTIEIYEQALSTVYNSRNIDEDKKAQAEDVLEYVKLYAPYFLPAVADGIKKVCYL